MNHSGTREVRASIRPQNVSSINAGAWCFASLCYRTPPRNGQIPRYVFAGACVENSRRIHSAVQWVLVGHLGYHS